MSKKGFLAFLCALALLLSGCVREQKSGYSFEEMTLTLDAAVAEGHLFFAGEVLSAGTNKQMITYYDVEAEENTFYQVKVTEDFFGCMPEEPITVCIYGTAGQFADRSNLEKGKEYLFDTTLWVHGEEAVFLLPTFYEGLPERQGETLYYTVGGKTSLVEKSYEDYKEHLFALAEEKGYGPALVKKGMVSHLEQAVLKDSAYFADLSFQKADESHLAATAATAQNLLEQLKNAAEDGEALRGILK